MNRQQESQGFRNQESNRSTNDFGYSQNNTSPRENQFQKISSIRHVYLEQENVYGRFSPYLLLKDKLTSQLDSSGNTVLHHMCSHDSPFLPLYLSTIQKNDPVLNMPSKMGHKPIDVAGIYCRKQYIDLLKQKGAIDNGNVDHWAIQGGNLQNWTGNVDISQKHLIHWAAYNDMPQVLKQFQKRGAQMDCKDGNNCTPLDLAVINKSYNSIKVLADLGLKPQAKLLSDCESKSIKQLFRKQNQSHRQKKMIRLLKILYTPLYFCLNIYLLIPVDSIIVLVFLLFSMVYWLFLVVKSVEPEPRYEQGRSSYFFSDLIQNQVNLKSNHLSYAILILSLFLLGITSIISSIISSYLSALVFWIVMVMTISFFINFASIVYGISQNLTHKQMYSSNECKHLWKKIRYIEQRQIFTRKYQNPFDKGIKNNIKDYLAKNL